MPKRNAASLPVKADLVPQIVKRYLAGESLQSVSADLRVHRATLYRWMLGGIGEENYRELVTDCLITRVSDADQQLADAADACDIARARETARFARMDLERRRPSLYGQRVELRAEVSVDPRLGLRESASALLARLSPDVLEHQPSIGAGEGVGGPAGGRGETGTSTDEVV